VALRQELLVIECEGPVVVHLDDAVECLEPDCLDLDDDHDGLESPCWLVFEGDCPRCGPLAA
jgi:hypothetical protein